MELDQIHKYISLNKQANGSVEVLFSGQPCLIVSEGFLGNIWKINPVFAKLVYGANVFEDIPQCSEPSPTVEEAVANGLTKLYDLGAFKTAYDFPEDTYAATMKHIAEDAKSLALSKTKSVMEATFMYIDLMKNLLKEGFSVAEGQDRSEFTANDKLSQNTQNSSKKIKIKDSTGRIVSSHDTENDALSHFKSMASNTGMKIVREEIEGDVEVVFESTKNDDEEQTKYDQWEKDVRLAHPEKELKFKGRIEQGTNTTSAEVSGTDRSYGVWDHDAQSGTVFTPEKEKEEDEAIQRALKKDAKFTSKKE